MLPRIHTAALGMATLILFVDTAAASTTWTDSPALLGMLLQNEQQPVNRPICG